MYMDTRTRSLSILVFLLVVALLLASCGPESLGIPIQEDATETSTATPTKTPTVVPVPGATGAPRVTVNVTSNDTQGKILTDQAGFVLYTSAKDTPGVSACTGDCLTTWPPLMTSDVPLAGDPSLKGKIGVINRPDGGQQVTYNGLPLYYYRHDAMPGDVKGLNISNDWKIAAP